MEKKFFDEFSDTLSIESDDGNVFLKAVANENHVILRFTKDQAVHIAEYILRVVRKGK